MTSRFRFRHNEDEFEVIGAYGIGEKFLITQFERGSSRMLSAAGTPSGTQISAVIADVENSDALHAELSSRYPNYTEFQQF